MLGVGLGGAPDRIHARRRKRTSHDGKSGIILNSQAWPHVPDGCTKIYSESTQGLSKVTNIASEELCDSDGIAELYKSGQAALGLRTSANPKPKPILDKTGAPAPVTSISAQEPV